MKLKRTYASIAKTEAQEDGTVKVWGYASTESEDSDGETIKADAMREALPDYMKFGAVREMHDAKKAAGTAIEARVEDDGRTWFGAHVVDSEAVKKVNAGVYKGFSIGGKVLARDDLNKSVIKAIKLVEVSLVDRPANPGAVFTMFKADGTEIDTDADEATDDPQALAKAAVDELAALLDAGTMTPQALVALAKAALAPPADTAAPVAKGMSGVARMAEMLGSLLWLVKDAQYEAAAEGDNSPLPDALKDWLDAGTVVLKAMVNEETAELLADATPPAALPYMVALAERAVGIAGRAKTDMEKAGKAISGATMTKLKAIHDACAELGACDPAAKHDHADDLTKAHAAHDDAMQAISKAAGAPEGAALADVITDLAKRASERDDALAKADTLAKEVERLKAMPAPGKALLKALSKGDDLGDPDAGTAPRVAAVTKGDGTVDDVATLIKSIHAGHPAR